MSVTLSDRPPVLSLREQIQQELDRRGLCLDRILTAAQKEEIAQAVHSTSGSVRSVIGRMRNPRPARPAPSNQSDRSDRSYPTATGAVSDSPELARARALEGKDGRGLLLRAWDLLAALDTRLLGEARSVVLTAAYRDFYGAVEAGLTAVWQEQYALTQAALLSQPGRAEVPEMGRKGGMASEGAADMLLHKSMDQHRAQTAGHVTLAARVPPELAARLRRHAEILGSPASEVMEQALEEYLDRRERRFPAEER